MGTEGTTEGDILSIAADDLYAFVIMRDTSEENSLLAVDSQTGSLLWSISSTNVTELALDETLFAAGENLCALNSETGELIWEFELEYFAASNVVVGPETVCVADRGNFLYAVDRTTGVLKWKTGWEGVTTGPIVQPYDFLIGGKGTIFCVGNLWDQGSIISAFNARDGSLFWKFSADLRSPPVLSEGIIAFNNRTR